MPVTLRLVASSLLCCLALVGQSEEGFTTKQRISRIRDLSKRNSNAIQALAPYVKDPNRDIRVEAVKAIVKIGGEESLAPLCTAAAHDSDPEVQTRATDGLINFYLPGYIARGLTSSVTRGVRHTKSFFASRNDQVIDPSVTIRTDVAQALADEISGASSIEARLNAALAAGILRARPAVPALVGSVRARQSDLIFQCLIALQKIKDPSAGPGVSTATHDLDERVQITALETVGMLGSLPSAPDVRAALANARNVKIRRAALEALAMLGIPSDRAVFQQHVENDDPELRAAALEGLGRIREPEDYPVLEKAYNEQNVDWRVHLAAAFALVNQGKVEATEYAPLPYLLENVGVKARANTASAYLAELVKKPEVRQVLTPLLAQTSKSQKLAMCAVLAESQSNDVAPVLNSLSRDIDPDVAVAASKALKTLQARQPS
jgi:HEAT repeat protein